MAIARLCAVPALAIPGAYAVGPRASGGRQAAQGAAVLAMAPRPPAEARPHTPPSPLAPHPFAPAAVLPFLRHGLRCRLEHGLACGCPLGPARRPGHPLRPRLPETVAEARQTRGALPQAEGRQRR